MQSLTDIPELVPMTPIYEKKSLENPVDNLNNDSFIYSSSERQSTKTAQEKTQKTPRRARRDLPIPYTAPWVLKRVTEGRLEDALTILRVWMPMTRRDEVSEELVNQIMALESEPALEAIQELAGSRRFIRRPGKQQLMLPVLLERLDNKVRVKVNALLDSGCTGSCINRSFVNENKIPTRKLPIAIPVYNADGTINRDGSISEVVDIRMTIQDHSERIQLAVTHLGETDVFIGFEWLKRHNPNIDWTEGSISFDRCPAECGHIPNLLDVDKEAEAIDHRSEEEDLNDGDRVFAFDWDDYVNSNRPAEQYARIRRLAIEESPDYVKEFRDVFSEKEFDHLPPRRPWDHAIELTPGFKPTDCKIYPLSPKEQDALDEFLSENLRTGRLRPSKSPMASPFFFVKKKDGKLRPVQDYRKLNEGTVKVPTTTHWRAYRQN